MRKPPLVPLDQTPLPPTIGPGPGACSPSDVVVTVPVIAPGCRYSYFARPLDCNGVPIALGTNVTRWVQVSNRGPVGVITVRFPFGSDPFTASFFGSTFCDACAVSLDAILTCPPGPFGGPPVVSAVHLFESAFCGCAGG